MHACAFGFTSFVVSMRACCCMLRVRLAQHFVCIFCLVLRIAAFSRCSVLEDRRAFAHTTRAERIHAQNRRPWPHRPATVEISVSLGFLDFGPGRRRPPLRFGATSPRMHAQAVTRSPPSAALTNREIGVSHERAHQNGPAAPVVWRPPCRAQIHACIRTFAMHACMHFETRLERFAHLFVHFVFGAGRALCIHVFENALPSSVRRNRKGALIDRPSTPNGCEPCLLLRHCPCLWPLSPTRTLSFQR